MKKVFFMLFTFGLFITLAACKTKIADSGKPVINGVYAITVIAGDEFNPMNEVTATDDVDGDITSSVVVTGTYDLNKVGNYSLTYSVKDKAGNSISKIRTLIVKEKYTFDGAGDVKIKVGSTFNALDGVKVKDNRDNSETTLVPVVTGTVNTAVKGEYTLTYTVTDAKNYTQSATRKVTVTNELIANPTFDGKLDPWGFWAGDGGSATASYKDGQAEIVVANIGTANYHVQFEQKNITIEKGKSYRISFQARALEPRTIGVLVEDPNNGYFKYTTGEGVVDGQKVISITTEMKTYFVDIFVNTNTITTAKLGFMLGKVGDNPKATTVYLDNFTAEEITAGEDKQAPVINGVGDVTVELNGEFNPLAGISVTDNQDVDLTVNDIVVTGTVDTTTVGDYTLTYQVTDQSGNVSLVYTRKVSVVSLVFKDTNEVQNGNFETNELVEWNGDEGVTGWLDWHQNSWGVYADVTNKIENGVLTSTIKALGDANASWSIQVQQNGINIEKGKTYKLVFDAKASVARDIKAVLKTRQDNVYAEKVLSLTTEMANYEMMFTVAKDSNFDMTIAFEMGMFTNTPQESVITFDNVKLLVLDEPTLVNGNFQDFGFEPWWDTPAYSGTAADASYSIIDGVMVVDAKVLGGAGWAVQLNQLNLTYEKDKTYKIQFDIKAETARYLEVKASDGNGGWHVKQVNATTEFVTYELEFTYTHDTKADNRINFELGYYADEVDGNKVEKSAIGKVYIDNVKLLVKGENDQFTDTKQVKNGDFQTALNWTRNQADADAPVVTVDGKAQIVVTEIGANNWSNQLFQTGLTLKAGRTYVIEFKANALAARPMEVKVEDPNNNYHTYVSKVVDLKTEVTTYTIEFTVNTGTITSGKLGFHLGPVSGTDVLTTVQFDDVYLYPKF